MTHSHPGMPTQKVTAYYDLHGKILSQTKQDKNKTCYLAQYWGTVVGESQWNSECQAGPVAGPWISV